VLTEAAMVVVEGRRIAREGRVEGGAARHALGRLTSLAACTRAVSARPSATMPAGFVR
jgi:hypothetical protein